MSEPRIGSQFPTRSVVLPYKETLGDEVADLYKEAHRETLEWQDNLLNDIMAINEEGLWTHTKVGYSVPRRNGKSEVIIPRLAYGLLHGEKILYTAHRTTTSHSMWERICKFLDDLGFVEITRARKDQDNSNAYKSLKQLGLETVEIYGLDGKIAFRTRSAKGGLGEGFDTLIIDEAQEYTVDQESALQYVVSDSPNPQIIMLGTPPTAVSSGTVFMNLRNSAFAGTAVDTMWAEWSIDDMTDDLLDRELWYQTNPSLGTVLTERKILAETTGDKVDFNIQRLGLWIKYSQKSLISEAEWNELEVKDFEPYGKLFAGVKFNSDGATVSMSIAVKTRSSKIFVEAIDCQSTRTGLGWILRFLKEADVDTVVIDGKSGQALLVDAIKDQKIKVHVIQPEVKEVILAGSTFMDSLYAKNICHAGQPSLVQSVSNCDKRPIGSGGGFGFKSLKDGIDVSLMESVVLAHWACSVKKERRKQKIIF